jgi:hypothetical protein
MPSSSNDDSLSPKEAMALVRANAESPPPMAQAIIERAMYSLWQRILADLDYTMTLDEFALFNWFRPRYEVGTNAPIVQRAAKVYWDSRRSANASSS